MVCEHDILNEHLYKTHFRDRCKFEIHVTILLIRQPMRWDGVDSNTRKIVPKFATRFAIISISEKKLKNCTSTHQSGSRRTFYPIELLPAY